MIWHLQEDRAYPALDLLTVGFRTTDYGLSEDGVAFVPEDLYGAISVKACLGSSHRRAQKRHGV